MLLIARTVYEQMRRHGEETYPEECCGVLAGTAGDGDKRVTRAERTGNARADSRGTGSASNRYEIAPLDIVRIQREAGRRGDEIVGFYHSHPDHPAQWSTTDLAEAHWLGCSYVITAVREGRAAETKSFHLAGEREEEKRFEDEAIVISD